MDETISNSFYRIIMYHYFHLKHVMKGKLMRPHCKCRIILILEAISTWASSEKRMGLFYASRHFWKLHAVVTSHNWGSSDLVHIHLSGLQISS